MLVRMADSTDLTDTIVDLASNPRIGEADGLKIEEHSIPDVVAGDRYILERRAASRRRGGIRITKIVSPGAD